jgi:hypothetical protein
MVHIYEFSYIGKYAAIDSLHKKPWAWLMDWAGWVPESVVRDNKISELKMYSQGFLDKHTRRRITDHYKKIHIYVFSLVLNNC